MKLKNSVCMYKSLEECQKFVPELYIENDLYTISRKLKQNRDKYFALLQDVASFSAYL